MEWAEVIRLQVPAGQGGRVLAELEAVLCLVRDKPLGLAALKTYQNIGSESDLTLVLLWQGRGGKPANSRLGLSLLHTVKSFGMASLTIWAETKPAPEPAAAPGHLP